MNTVRIWFIFQQNYKNFKIIFVSKVFVNTPNSIMTTFKNIGLEINIPDLQYIINVDFPPNLQTYMDRVNLFV